MKRFKRETAAWQDLLLGHQRSDCSCDLRVDRGRHSQSRRSDPAAIEFCDS